MPRYEKIGRHIIHFDQVYYLAYAGGSRELDNKKQDLWNRTLTLPWVAQRKEQKNLGFKNNPNVIPLKGIKLLEFIRDLKFTPFFDSFFEKSHLLQLTDVLVYESIKAKSYEMAMKGK